AHHSNAADSTLNIAAGQELIVSQVGTDPDFTNNGAITIPATARLQVLGGTLREPSWGVDGTGDIHVEDGTFDIGAAASSAVTWTLLNAELKGAGSVTNTGTVSLQGGALVSLPMTNEGTIEATAGTNTFAAPLTAPSSGRIDTRADATLVLDAPLTNQGQLAIRDASTVSCAKPLTNQGTIELIPEIGSRGTPLLSVTTGGLANEAGGVVRSTGGPTAAISRIGCPINSAGSIDVEAPLELTAEGVIHTNTGVVSAIQAPLLVTGAQSFDNAGDVLVADPGGLQFTGTPFRNLQAGTLSGTGTVVVGDDGVENAGTISPGASAGNLLIDGDLALTATSILDIELGGTVPGPEHDRIQVTQTATLDGTLVVTLIAPYDPPVWTDYSLVEATDVVGEFAEMDLPPFSALDLDRDWIMEYHPPQALLRVVYISDLVITHQVSPAVVIPGNDVTYTLEITNNGRLDAPGSTLSATLPAAFDEITVSVSGNAPIPWTGDLALGELAFQSVTQVVVTGTVRPETTTDVISSFEVSSDHYDPNPPDNLTGDLVTPVVPMMAILKKDRTIAADDTTFDGYDLTIGDGERAVTVTIDGAHDLKRLTVADSAILTHSPATDETTSAIDLSIEEDLIVNSGAVVTADALGYLGGNQPGNASPVGRTSDSVAAGGSAGVAGGSHGGPGGGHATPYDSPTAPSEPGAGGGSVTTPGGNGGGVIRLAIGGTLHNDGLITACGDTPEPGEAGGGAGGSIRLSVDSLAGAGEINAWGGNGGTTPAAATHGGGGGRIALLYTGDTPFSGTVTCYGGGSGNAGQNGGAGTVYWQDIANGTETLVLNNHGASANHAYSDAPGLTALTTLSVSEGARLSSESLTNVGDVDLLTGGTLKAPLQSVETLTMDGGSYIHWTGDTTLSINSPLSLLNGSLMTHEVSHAGAVYGLDVYISGTLTVDNTSAIDVSGNGYLGANVGDNLASNTGRTQDNTTSGGSSDTAGGSHGGVGGEPSRSVSATYGDMTEPSLPGAGGGALGDLDTGGNGGGTIRIQVTGALSYAGTIAADGQPGAGMAGGGAGGSIWLEAPDCSGTGQISANGGSGGAGGAPTGGGGGGRVALDAPNATITGTITAAGGTGGNSGPAGQDGTVYYPYGITWSGLGDEVLWSDTANWNPPVQPNAWNSVFLTLEEGIQAALDIDAQVAGLQIGGDTGTQTLTISQSSLTLGGNGDVGENGVLIVDGGTIDGVGVIANDGAITLRDNTAIELVADNRGSISVSSGAVAHLNGGLTTGDQSSLVIAGGDTQLYIAGDFSNRGQLRIEATEPGDASLYLESGVLTNLATGAIETQGTYDARMVSELHNAGSINVRTTTTIGADGAQHTNTGTINLQDASLELSLEGEGGSFSNGGPVSIADGSTLRIRNGAFHELDWDISGAGVLDLEQTEFTLDGTAVSLLSWTLLDTDVIGTGSLTNQGDLDLRGRSRIAVPVANESAVHVQGLSNELTAPLTTTEESMVTLLPGAALTITAPLTNQGLILLETNEEASPATTLTVESTPFENGQNGILRTAIGAQGSRSPTLGGNPVSVIGALLNRGLLDLLAPLVLSGSEETHVNEGTINATNALLQIDEAAQFDNAGVIFLDTAGGMALQGTPMENTATGVLSGNGLIDL
ncbi:MAG: DUF11 domain-containing protein, partial [Lentisphaerae bacterium]|nr:DUF11 domain-containing protein [Lentisphaerota bacterium]